MNHEQAFLADILEHPDDDGPRLIFADWLDDHDQPDRAEFIRLQVEAERQDEYDPGRPALLERIDAVLDRCRDRWLGELPGRTRKHAFRRGLLERVDLRVEVLLEHGERLLAGHPVRELRLYFEPGDADRAERVARCPALASVETLDLSNIANLTVTALAQLARSPHLGRLKHLNLAATALGDAGVEAIVSSPLAARLVSLDLSNNPLRGPAAERLAGGALEQLRTLRLAYTRLSAAAVEALAGSRRLPRLHQLDLSGNSLNAAAARALAASSRLAELRDLNLAGDAIGPDGAAALARSPHLRRLERLCLLGNGIAVGGATEFARGAFLDSMQTLEISGNRLGTAGVIALTKASPANLEYLLLGTDEVDDDALRALARWPALASLRELNLYNNSATAFGMRALVDSPHAGRLRHMNLAHNRLGDMGAEVLAGWPGLAGMRWLKLSHNGIGDRGALALARSPHWQLTPDLDLSDNDVTDESKAAFNAPEVRRRVLRVAPWDADAIIYHPPYTPQRPRG